MTSGRVLTLEQLDAELDRYAASVRATAEAHMPPEVSAPLWESVARHAAHHIEDELYDPDAPAPRSAPPRASRRCAGAVIPAAPVGGDEPLRQIEPALYVEALTGVEVPPSGVIRCPLPGHDDRTPSFKAYRDPAQGFYCFGCGAGGGIIDFGAAWYGIEPRGSGYHEIRERLECDLLAALRSAA